MRTNPTTAAGVAPPYRRRARRPRAHVPIVLLGAAVLGACSEASAPEPDPALGPRPILLNLAVPFDSVFNVDSSDQIILKFMEFGHTVLDENQQPKPLPHFSYVFDRRVGIISPMDGIVYKLHYQADTDDYAIWLKPHGGPTLWLVELDHVQDVQVAEGDTVGAGDLLAYPLWFGTMGVVEFMVNAPHAHVCPFEVFAPGTAAELQARLTAFMADWDAAKWALPPDHPLHPEHVSGYYTPYSDVGRVVPGCLSWEVSY